jgi:hypothetical protein
MIYMATTTVTPTTTAARAVALMVFDFIFPLFRNHPVAGDTRSISSRFAA